MLVLFRMCVSARKYLHVVRMYVSARGPYLRFARGPYSGTVCYVSARGPYLRSARGPYTGTSPVHICT